MNPLLRRGSHCRKRFARSPSTDVLVSPRVSQDNGNAGDVVRDLAVRILHPRVETLPGQLPDGLICRRLAPYPFSTRGVETNLHRLLGVYELPHAVGAQKQKELVRGFSIFAELDLLDVGLSGEASRAVPEDVADGPRHVEAGVQGSLGEDPMIA